MELTQEYTASEIRFIEAQRPDMRYSLKPIGGKNDAGNFNVESRFLVAPLTPGIWPTETFDRLGTALQYAAACIRRN